MNHLIALMNQIMLDWKKYYFVEAADLEIQEDIVHSCFLNSPVNLKDTDILLSAVHFDSKRIALHFDDDHILCIEIAWPDNSLPVISSLHMGASEP